MKKNRIYLSPPNVGNIEKELLLKAYKSNWISPLGPNVDGFEKEVADYLDVKYSCALSSGTAALHLALKVLGIKKGDFVLCPSMTFVASSNVILYEQAIPIFIDVNFDDWTIDIKALEIAVKKYKPKILISVDLYGQSCNYDAIDHICKKYKVLLIEDSAEALGSEYKNKKLGSYGDLSILSFNGNKIITTSGGGMLISENEDYVNRAMYYSTQSREPFRHYEHKEIGYNYRLSNLLVAIGRGQLKKIDSYVSKKREVFNRYFDNLSSLDGFVFMQEAKNCFSNRWLTTLLIDSNKSGIDRDDIIRALEEENIESRPVWKPMHLQPLYKKNLYVKSGKKDNSADLFMKGICLPSGSNLDKKDQYKIIEIIKSLLN